MAVSRPAAGIAPFAFADTEDVAGIVAAVAARFCVPELAVREVATLPWEVLRERERYFPPSDGLRPVLDAPRFPLGSAQVMSFGDDPYVHFLAEFDPNRVEPTEAEENIRSTPTYQAYVEWARAGIKPPYTTVFETVRGGLVTPNRRRTLAAREAGRMLTSWVGVENLETGIPLKYWDLVDAIKETRMSINQESNVSDDSVLAEIAKAFGPRPAGYDAGYKDALESMVLALRGVVWPAQVSEAVTTALDAFANNAPEPAEVAPEQDLVTVAYVAQGAHAMLLERCEKDGLYHPPVGEVEFIDEVIRHAATLDEIVTRDHPDGLSGVFAYEVAEPFGAEYGAWYLDGGHELPAAAGDLKAREIADRLIAGMASSALQERRVDGAESESAEAAPAEEAPPAQRGEREGLWKSVITVWSDVDPQLMEASELVLDGESGDSFIESCEAAFVTDRTQWPDTDFFGSGDDEDSDEDEDEDDDDEAARALPAPGM
jgi:hypothetical protein